jgi:hypothetical protein
MRVEVSYVGVAKNRVYYATPATQGRPRKNAAITKSRKVFATGSTRSEAIENLKSAVGFVPFDKQ